MDKNWQVLVDKLIELGYNPEGTAYLCYEACVQQWELGGSDRSRYEADAFLELSDSFRLEKLRKAQEEKKREANDLSWIKSESGGQTINIRNAQLIPRDELDKLLVSPAVHYWHYVGNGYFAIVFLDERGRVVYKATK